MAEQSFHSFHEEETGEPLATQKKQEQQEDKSTDDICYLENICTPEQPIIS